MRQKNVIIVVGVALAAGLVGFSLARIGGDQGGGPADRELAGGETRRADAEHHHHASDDTPSGEMVAGVRVVKLAAHTSKLDPARIVVQEGENVRLDVTSEDVVHRIVIKAYGVDRKLDPHKTEAITFTADKLGRHDFHCSICCDKGADHMHGSLVVVELAAPAADKDR